MSPETCRADWVRINKPKVASCWSSVTKDTHLLCGIAGDCYWMPSSPKSVFWSRCLEQKPRRLLSSGMRRPVFGWFPTFRYDIVFSFRGSTCLYSRTYRYLKVTPLCLIETSGTSYLVRQLHILKERTSVTSFRNCKHSQNSSVNFPLITVTPGCLWVDHTSCSLAGEVAVSSRR